MGIEDIRATKQQKAALRIYLETAGDMVAAYEQTRSGAPARVGEKQRLTRAQNWFGTPTMRKLLKEADAQALVSIQRREDAGIQTALTKYGISKEKIIAELAKIAFTNPTDIMEWDENGVRVKSSDEIGDAASAIKEVSSTGGGDKPVNMKISLMDRRQALIDIGKEVYGMFGEKVEHSGTVAVAARFIIEGKTVEQPFKIIEGK